MNARQALWGVCMYALILPNSPTHPFIHPFIHPSPLHPVTTGFLAPARLLPSLPHRAGATATATRTRTRGAGSPRMAVDILHGILGQMDPSSLGGVMDADVLQGAVDTAASAAAAVSATAGEVAEEAKKDPGLFDKFVNVVMSSIESVHGEGSMVCGMDLLKLIAKPLS